MLVVAALGGNALLRRGEPADAETQRRNVDIAVDALVEIANEHQLVVTHGNGPQVGLLALQSEAYTAVTPYPLDVLGAESEGMIGYLLEQGLENRLGHGRAATLLTQVRRRSGGSRVRAPDEVRRTGVRARRGASSLRHRARLAHRAGRRAVAAGRAVARAAADRRARGDRDADRGRPDRRSASAAAACR